MPYIKKEKRWEFFEDLENLSDKIESVGDLDYCITTICKNFMKKNGGVRFENLAKIAGTILFVILENYRRIAAPYEEIKKVDNGDVYQDVHIGENK